MNADAREFRAWLPLAARVVLGGLFIYLGAAKALDPVGFLKLVRQFDLVTAPLALNVIAAVLPWLEILCGAALVGGVRPRAAALVSLALLAAFTGAVALRAWGLHRGGAQPFCALRFDCGCGAGEVAVCAKLAENTALLVLAGFVVAARPKPPA